LIVLLTTENFAESTILTLQRAVLNVAEYATEPIGAFTYLLVNVSSFLQYRLTGTIVLALDKTLANLTTLA
jgi:hypothetical protein